MSEGADKESKTQEATPRRIEEALNKGQTPFSREVVSFATILAVALLLPIATVPMAGHAIASWAMFLDRPADFQLATADDVAAMLVSVALVSGAAIAPLLIALMIVSIFASVVQNAPRIALHRIKPDLKRISLQQGWERLLGAQGRMEFAKALAKIVIVCILFFMLLRSGQDRVLGYVMMSERDLPMALLSDISGLFLATALLVSGLALADWLWSRLKWQIDLRMSHHELKEEHKQAEGDPLIRSRMRSLARDRARQRMMAAVPRATLVIANPTHFAVALRYVHGETASPLVLAKGMDLIALKIREIAEQNDIPVVEDKALARSLFEAVEVDQAIPPQFYRALAEIIMLLMSQQSARLRGF